MKHVCLVIPCLNEARTLRRNMPLLVSHLRSLPAIRWEVMIVDNGSTDDTAAVAQEFGVQFSEVSWQQQPARGRGNAIRLAWQQSRADVLAYMDADLAVDLAHITNLVAPILNGQADVIFGDRFAAGSLVQRSWFRELLSQGYRHIARALLGGDLQDYQCGFKAINVHHRDELLRSIANHRWFFDTELLVLARIQGLRVQGIPVHWRDRNETRVRFLPTILSDLWLLAKLRRRLKCTARAWSELRASNFARPATTWSFMTNHRSQHVTAFTLLELLVVIAIIAALAAMLLPAVSRAKERARQTQCLGQLKQLQIAYLGYTDDYQQWLPLNAGRPDPVGNWRGVPQAWCGESSAPWDTDTRALQAGAIFPYIRNDALYRCPSDFSHIYPTLAVPKPTALRTRSYAVNGCLRGYSNEWYQLVLRLTEVKTPASVLAFIDESENTIDDGHFMIHLPPSLQTPNSPSRRHGHTTSVSFLDGHCEAIAFGADASVLQRYTVHREP